MIRKRLRLELLGVALVLLVASRLSPARSSYPGGIGSGGGDIVQAMLVVTRSSLTETLARLATKEDGKDLCRCTSEADPNPLCRYLMKGLTGEQRDFCRKFILETHEEMHRLSLDPSIELVPVLNGLIVNGPDGKKMPVIAYTKLGPEGDILFQADAIRALAAPVQLLSLLGHELGHKVAFGGAATYVDDNSPIGPFSKSGGSRMLLDSVGVGLAHYAEAHDLTGSYFGIEDKFSCTIDDVRDAKSLVSAHGASPRWRTEDRRGYDTGVGNHPQDFICALDRGDFYLFYRAKIHEMAGCRSTAAPVDRFSVLELWRVSKGDPDDAPPPVLLERRPLSGWNPTCSEPEKAPALRLDYPTAKPRYRFEVRYEGTRVILGGYRSKQHAAPMD